MPRILLVPQIALFVSLVEYFKLFELILPKGLNLGKDASSSAESKNDAVNV